MLRLPIIILLIVPSLAFSQKQLCQFPIDSAKNFHHQGLSSLIDSLEPAQVKTLNKRKYIPKIIRQTLNCWTNKFDIANANKSYQTTDVIHSRLKPLPLRQITYLGVGSRYFILTYKKGGFAASDHILIFRYEKKKIVDAWIGSNVRLNSKDEILYFLRNHNELIGSNLNL